MSDGAPWSEVNESAQHDLVAKNKDPEFVILYSKQCNGNCAIFWRPKRNGYTIDLDEAGRYSKEEALEIHEGRHGEDMPVPVEEAYKLAQRHVSFDAAREVARSYLLSQET